MPDVTMSEEEENSVETSESESSSDSDEEIIQDIPDKDFFKTLSLLKNKDPRIYDNSTHFFTERTIVAKDKQKQGSPANEDLKVSKKEQVMPDSNLEKNSIKKTHFKESNKKFSLKDLDNDSSSEDELMALKKCTSESLPVETEPENECIEFLKGTKAQLEDKEFERELKPLQNYWNTEVLDENEKFLKDYILNKRYLGNDEEVNDEHENLSEDERELEEQAEYEANYNFRFENNENLQIKRFPRNVEGSLRRKNDARSKKRAELAQRKKEEKAKKYLEVKKKQKEKLSEIEERLQKLKELTGNVELGFKDEEILEDFDPEKHDQKMKELFNEEYYNKEDYEHPVFNDDEDYWGKNNFDLNCEGEVDETQKLTRTQRKKLRKKKTFKDVMDIAKPSFDPKVHSDFKKYIDEYYSLDCEDFIDDIPCKFKYREVVPNDYGLSIEEILMADDSELNRWASVKKICRRRPEHVEKNEVNIYKKKAQDEALKKKILKSLYTLPEQDEADKHHQNNTSMKKFMTEKHSNKFGNMDVENSLEVMSGHEELSNCASNESTEQDHNLNKNEKNQGNKKAKKKKRKHKDVKTEESISSMVSENDENNLDKISKIYLDSEEQLTENGLAEILDEENDNERNKEHIGQTISKSNAIEISDVSKLTNNIPNSLKKKRRKKKKKKHVSSELADDELLPTASSDSQINKLVINKEEIQLQKKEKINKNKNKVLKVKEKGKFKNKLAFKKKKQSIVNLSDSRLQAYGIKPKQFRAKMLYSQKNKSS